MRVKVLHQSEMYEVDGHRDHEDSYFEKVPDNAGLQEIWDHCVNGGSPTTELTDNIFIEVAEEGRIHWNDENPNQAGCQITITWDSRD